MLAAPFLFAGSCSKKPEVPQVAGARLTSIEAGSVFDRLGLKPNDLIIEVNGKPMDTMEAARDLDRASKVDDHLELKVMRGNETLKFEYKIK